MLFLLLMSLVVADPQPKPSTPSAKQAANDPDKMICRRFAVTGSLVNSYKTCKTRREWDSEYDALRGGGPGSDPCRNSGNGGPC